MLGEVFPDYSKALADRKNIRMLRTVVRQQALLFQQERQKYLLVHVPGHLLVDAPITGLGESGIAPACLFERNRAGLPNRDRFATLPRLDRFAAALR
jgi:hypothetical protein